jgi:hypothetical protein
MRRILRRARQFVRDGIGITADAARTERSLDQTKMLVAQLVNRQTVSDYACLSDAEFKVFSQFGDDGIIQYLIRRLQIDTRTFIEFGVDNYKESNTRYLLAANNWKGLVIDGDEQNIQLIKKEAFYWQHDLTAVCSFVTAQNINQIFRSNGFHGEIGLLSIDIDGNDYHLWKAIDSIQPRIVVAEYNSVFGAEHAVTVPYDPQFRRYAAHHSGLYAGASLKALWVLAQQKGYAFIGSNSAGNNAYFVREDKASGLRPLTVAEGFVESRFRESKDEKGQPSFLGGRDRLKAIQGLPVYDIEAGCIRKIQDLF